MAQIKITANEERKFTIISLENYIQENFGINIKDFYIWRMAFILSLKQFDEQTDLSRYKKENHLTVSQNYETLIDEETKYIFVNLLSLKHNRKIDIKEDFPELLKLHCRHGFDILADEIEGIGVNDNIIDFFINQLEIPKDIKRTPQQNQHVDNELIIKFKKALQEIKAPLKFIEEKSYDRVNKLLFDIEDINYATTNKLYGNSIILQLESATGLKSKIYVEQTKRERVVSINILRDNKPIYINTYENTINKNDLEFIVGMDDEDILHKANLKDLAHLLVAGTTGSGKTVFLHSLIYQFIQKNVELYLIDGKNGFEFGQYEDEASVITDSKEIRSTIKELIEEMEERYLSKNIEQFKPIIIVVDEFVDLIMKISIIEDLFIRLAQKGRGAKIHLVLAIQRPDSQILKGVLHSNLPSRVAFKVQNSTESKIILDETGAENLFGKGDMLFSDGKELKRLQGFLLL